MFKEILGTAAVSCLIAFTCQAEDSIPDARQIAEETLDLSYIGDQTYDLELYSEDGKIHISTIESAGILSAYENDFDGDGQQEIFCVSFEESNEPEIENSIHFSIIKKEQENWEVAAQQEILETGTDGQTGIVSGLNDAFLFTTESVFFRKTDGVFEFYYECYADGIMATGQKWYLTGYRFENNQLDRIEETDSLRFWGSPISMIWNSDGSDTYANILQDYRALGFQSSEVSQDWMTADQNEGLSEILRMKKNSTLSMDEIQRWWNGVGYGKVQSTLSGFYFAIDNKADEIQEESLEAEEIEPDQEDDGIIYLGTAPESQESANSSDTSAREKYDPYIEQFDEKNQTAIQENQMNISGRTYVAYADIDQNGVEECIVKFSSDDLLTTASDSIRTEIYTLEDDTVKIVLEQEPVGSGWYPIIHVYQDWNMIYAYTSGHALISYDFYPYQDGDLNGEARYSCQYGMDGVYYIDGTYETGTVASEAEFERYLKHLIGGKDGYPIEAR